MGRVYTNYSHSVYAEDDGTYTVLLGDDCDDEHTFTDLKAATKFADDNEVDGVYDPIQAAWHLAE